MASSIAGNLLGGFLTFDTNGIEFVLTSLFVVIFINQWIENRQHSAAIIGLVCSFACLAIFGPNNFMIPAMAAIILVLMLFKKQIERGVQQ